MTVERLIRIIAGSFIILSVLIFNAQTESFKLFESVNFLWFTLFVGANLFQSGFSKWCLMGSILKKAGIKTTV